jgi:hypothetical protein
MAKEARQGRSIGIDDLSRRFGLTTDAASGHVLRLWRERLIATTTRRPSRFRFRLCPGERIRGLEFQLVMRGRERLRWYLDQAEDESSRDSLWQ